MLCSLHQIMHGIHQQCVKYGTEPNGYVKLRQGCQRGRLYESRQSYDGTRRSLSLISQKLIIAIKSQNLVETVSNKHFGTVSIFSVIMNEREKKNSVLWM